MYEGGLRAGKRHGHGYLKQGKLTTGVASIYIGEWLNDKKCGFGVHSDILKGNSMLPSSIALMYVCISFIQLR